MLICHCNVIAEADIKDAIRALLAEDEWRLIVPLHVYHEMGKRGRCCGCFPNVVDVIVQVTEEWHRAKASPEAEVICIIERLRVEHARLEGERAAVRERMRQSSAA